MDTEARLSGFGLSLLGALIAISIAFAVSASIVDTDTLRSAAPAASQSTGQTAHTGQTGTSGRSEELPAARAVKSTNVTVQDGSTKLRARCRGCGIVEAVHRVKRSDVSQAVCRTFQGNPGWVERIANDKRADSRPIVLAADAMLAGQLAPIEQVRSEAKWDYQLIVRFPDGSRHLFVETTPRTLQLGERVQVIPGLDSNALLASDTPDAAHL